MRICYFLLGVAVSVLAIAAAPEAARERMVKELLRHGDGITRVTDPRVIAAMEKVPRHRFVDPAQARNAYADRPLPIGFGQTISQPYIVAIMTQLLAPEPGMRVLEVGTGSGYQAAVLAELIDEVYTIETVAPLAQAAKQLLLALGYSGVQTRLGDGYHGWPEAAPFDRIAVTAAAEHIPPPLIEQLRPGGHMVIPVGSRWGAQQLMLVNKSADGAVSTHSLLSVRFVPLVSAGD